MRLRLIRPTRCGRVVVRRFRAPSAGDAQPPPAPLARIGRQPGVRLVALMDFVDLLPETVAGLADEGFDLAFEVRRLGCRISLRRLSAGAALTHSGIIALQLGRLDAPIAELAFRRGAGAAFDRPQDRRRSLCEIVGHALPFRALNTARDGARQWLRNR